MFGNDHAGIACVPAVIDLEDRMEVDINRPVENQALSLLLKEPAAAEDCARAELRFSGETRRQNCFRSYKKHGHAARIFMQVHFLYIDPAIDLLQGRSSRFQWHRSG